MITAAELKGVMGMMPAFTTADGGSVHSTDTIDVDALEKGVDRIIEDGIGLIATTGSFGEFHTLLWDEQKKLIDATVRAADKRVPVFAGCTSLNTREAMMKMRFIQESGADGVLTGVPFYFHSTVPNAIQFYHDIADAFPTLGIMIYHNPPLHNVTLPPSAFRELVKKPNIVGMKDSHRDPMGFMQLQQVVRGKISVFVNQLQLHPYMSLGAAGCWSISAWMGPAPVIRAYRACVAGDPELAQEICMAMAATNPGPIGLQWRESSAKLAVNEAGYCHAGPLRPPFTHVPDEIKTRAAELARRWRELCEKYPLSEEQGRRSA